MEDLSGKKIGRFFLGGVVIAEKVERLVYVCVCVFLFGKVSEWVMVSRCHHVIHGFWAYDLNHLLGGGFKYFLFSPLFGEDVQFD